MNSAENGCKCGHIRIDAEASKFEVQYDMVDQNDLNVCWCIDHAQKCCVTAYHCVMITSSTVVMPRNFVICKNLRSLVMDLDKWGYATVCYIMMKE